MRTINVLSGSPQKNRSNRQLTGHTSLSLMTEIRLVRHARGAPGTRLIGLGPSLRPRNALLKLQNLLNGHTQWANGRSLNELRAMLAGSAVVVSLWQGKRMVGFGRATSDGIYRAVLWDVVVANDLQGQGLGRRVVDALLDASKICNSEKVYLMTSKSRGFYEQLGFHQESEQILLKRINR